MTTTRTALVIGAGIAGPVAAMALRKAGIRPTVYEAHPTRAEGIGTFLTIASNGIDALRVIGADEPALAAGARAHAVAPVGVWEIQRGCRSGPGWFVKGARSRRGAGALEERNEQDRGDRVRVAGRCHGGAQVDVPVRAWP